MSTTTQEMTTDELETGMSPQERRETREQIVRDLRQEHTFATMHPPGNELFVYDSRPDSPTFGTWQSGLAEKIIVERVESAMGLHCTRYDKKEVIAHIKHLSYHRSSSDADFWDSAPKNLLPVKNGVIDISTGELLEHHSKYHFLSKSPVEYIPPDDPRLKDKNRDDIFIREIHSKEEDVQAAYELAGYCLYRGYFIQLIFLLVGEGANGKSTFLNLLRALLGKENVSNISLQSLCYRRFSIANLRGKHANIYNDLSASALKNTGRVKMLVGGDPLSGEKKFIQGYVNFINYAKLIFSCNRIPPVIQDDTRAFWRRWNLTKYEKIFDEEHENVDKEMLEKLTDPLELSAFLNNALEGLRRLLKSKRFSNYKNVEETRTDYIMKSDPIWAFAETRLEERSEAYEAKSVVYEAYKEFCKEKKLPSTASNVFSRVLKKYVSIGDGQRRIGGRKNVTCYLGIALKRGAEDTVGVSQLDPQEREDHEFSDDLRKEDWRGKCPICGSVVGVGEEKVRLAPWMDAIDAHKTCIKRIDAHYDGRLYYHTGKTWKDYVSELLRTQRIDKEIERDYQEEVDREIERRRRGIRDST